MRAGEPPQCGISLGQQQFEVPDRVVGRPAPTLLRLSGAYVGHAH